MARRISPSQFRSKLRQAESRLRQAQNQQKQGLRRLEQDVRRHQQKRKAAIDAYNREVRAYNARVEKNRQKINNALRQLQSKPTTTRTSTFTIVRSSAVRLNETYTRLERQNPYDDGDPGFHLGLELPQQENANNLALANALAGEPVEEEGDEEDLQNTTIGDQLAQISADLHDRWHGALFALNPRNPDAARHFCTSVREIFTQILHARAPDDAVLAAAPDCQKDNNGRPTRRARIYHLLRAKNLASAELVEFVDEDIENVIELFGLFNKGTHGKAGALGLSVLLNMKRRVEDAIIFVTRIAA